MFGIKNPENAADVNCSSISLHNAEIRRRTTNSCHRINDGEQKRDKPFSKEFSHAHFYD